MRALFVGGTVDNSELDMEGQPPAHYPENTGAGRPRYRLHHVGRVGGDAAEIAYAVYAAPDLADAQVQRVVDERDYARRFGVVPTA